MAPPTAGDDYVWIGPDTGSWDTASNWEDLTAGDDPALVPPGADDNVTITSPAGQTLTITGTGSAAALALKGAIAIDADLTIGTLTNPAGPPGSPQITLDAGSIVNAGTATLNDVSLALGASLDVTTALSVGPLTAAGSIVAGSATFLDLAAHGANVKIAGGLTLGAASAAGRFTVDQGSDIQVGSLAVDGSLTLDNTAALQVGAGGEAPGALVINAGASAVFGGAGLTDIAVHVGDNGTLTLAAGEIDLEYGLTGNGVVEIQRGADLNPFSVGTGNLTFQLDRGAILPLGPFGPGNTIALEGYNLLTLPPNTAVSATITGFDPTDAIDIFNDVTVLSLTLDAGDTSAQIVLNSLGAISDTLTLNGDYAADHLVFVSGSQPNPAFGSTPISEIFLEPTAPTAVSAGTGTGDDYVWTGGLFGYWNDAANWQDVTAGAGAAIVAPGSLDHVTIAGSTTLAQVIAGEGDAASLAFTGNVIVAGQFTVGTLSGNVTLYDGASVVAGSAVLGAVTIEGDSQLSVTSVVTAGTVTIGDQFAQRSLTGGSVASDGTLTAGSASFAGLTAYGGAVSVSGVVDLGVGKLNAGPARVQVGALTAGMVSVNSFGSVEIGDKGNAAKAAVTVDAGATLNLDSSVGGGGSILANVVDNGLIAVSPQSYNTITGTLHGTGTIQVGNGATLTLLSDSSSSVDISLQGADDTIYAYLGHDVGAQITNFVPGDQIMLYAGYPAVAPGTASLNGDDLTLTVGNAASHFYLPGLAPGASFTASHNSSSEYYYFTETLCFCARTLIQTDRGPVLVEHLAIGDTVITADGTPEPIRWIGQRSYAGSFIAGNAAMLPICVRAGALADGVPSRDLWVSPGHALLVDGQLVPAMRLVNGVSVTQASRVETVHYYHVELHRHAILLANDAPAESYLDIGSRNQFQNAASFHAADPDAAPMPALAPRLEDGFALQSIQDRLATRAGIAPSAEPIGALHGFVDQATGQHVCGWAQDCDSPEEPVVLEIRVGGIPALCVPANAYRADLQQGGRGSGCHAFKVTLDGSFEGPITVRRVADGAVLPFTTAATAALAA